MLMLLSAITFVVVLLQILPFDGLIMHRGSNSVLLLAIHSNMKVMIRVAGACEYGNELSGSIKCGEFLD
jgi:hypothetical protein